MFCMFVATNMPDEGTLYSHVLVSHRWYFTGTSRSVLLLLLLLQHFLMDLHSEGAAPPPTPPRDAAFGYEFFRRSAEEAATIVADRMRDGDVQKSVGKLWPAVSPNVQPSLAPSR